MVNRLLEQTKAFNRLHRIMLSIQTEDKMVIGEFTAVAAESPFFSQYNRTESTKLNT